MSGEKLRIIDGEGTSKGSIKLREWRPRKNNCEHVRTLIDSSERTLECEDCGSAVDPFTYLMGLASKQYSLEWQDREERKAEQHLAWFWKRGGRLSMTASQTRASIDVLGKRVERTSGKHATSPPRTFIARAVAAIDAVAIEAEEYSELRATPRPGETTE